MSALDVVVPVAHAAIPAPGPLLPVVGGDLRVPLAGAGGRTVRYANLDYAATAPALATVAERVTRVLPFYGSVHRGAGLPSQVSTALYERSRDVVARFAGARADDVVVFARNTTDALNLLARSVPAGAGAVVHLDAEHHANLLPWRRRGDRRVAVAPTLRETLARLEAACAAGPTALVAITGASNVTGELVPLERVVALARRHGARVAVDAAQLAPHRRIDVAALGVDWVALSGHKLYAPYGAGALIGRADWLDAATPLLDGGGAVADVALAPEADRVVWKTGPARHEAGTPNLAGAVALAQACATLGELPAGALERHEAALRARLLDGLARVPGVRVVRIWEDAADAIGVVAFTVGGWDPAHVAAYLSAEHGVGVRDGRFCAHPLLAALGLGDGALRASFGVGTGAADVDRLVAALAALVSDGPRLAYERTATGWAPADDDRDLAAWLGEAGDGLL